MDFVNIVRKNNWEYEEFWKVNYFCDIICCFDEFLKDGSILFDFLIY